MLNRTLLTRAILLRHQKNVADNLKQTKRNAGHGTWTYRMPPPTPSSSSRTLAYIGGGIAWYWILYHIATEPEHIIGEWTYLPPETWTDEELGIPPDSVGPLKKCPPC